MPIDIVVQDAGGAWIPIELPLEDPTPKDKKNH